MPPSVQYWIIEVFFFGQLYSLSSSLKLAHMFGSGPLQGVAPIRNLLAVHSVHHHVAGIFFFGAWQTPESGPPDVSVSPPGAAFVHQLGDLENFKGFCTSVFCILSSSELELCSCITDV